jgi:hypothetical protein
MNGGVISELGKERFCVYYKEILEEGYYIEKSKETQKFIISNKRPEMNEKQKANYEEFVKNIFLTV